MIPLTATKNGFFLKMLLTSVFMFVLYPMILFSASLETMMREAQNKAQLKDYFAAISIYDAILRQKPGYLEAQIGKARTLSWAGKYQQSQTIYEAVLLQDPNNIEASIGLADLNAWQKQYEKATEILERLRASGQDNRIVLTKLARYYLWMGEKSLSAKYCEELLKKYPEDQEAKAIQEKIGNIHNFEYYVGYQYLKIMDTDGHNVYAGTRYQLTKKFSLHGQFDYLDKYGKVDMRGLLGGSWKAHRYWTFSSEIGVATNGKLYPRLSGWIEAASSVIPSTVLFARIFASQHQEVDSYGVSFAGEYYTIGYICVGPKVTFSQTEFHTGEKALDSSYAIKVTKFFTDMNKAFVYFGYGSESFKIETINLIGGINAKTYGVGGAFFLNSEIGISLFVEYQDRGSNIEFLQIGLELKRLQGL